MCSVPSEPVRIWDGSGGRSGSDVASSRMGKFGLKGEMEGKEIDGALVSSWGRCLSLEIGGEQLVFAGEFGRTGGLLIFLKAGGGGET